MSSSGLPATELAPAISLQTATGGSITVVLLVFVALFVATVLSVYLAFRLYRGYRAGGGSAMRFLAVGLVGITVVPFIINYGIAPAIGVSDALTLFAVLLANIAGLLSILYSLDGT